MVPGTLNIDNSGGLITQCEYSKERNREKIAKMVIFCGLPFSFSSRPDFIQTFNKHIILLLKVF